MIYNPEYNRWFTKSRLVFKYDVKLYNREINYYLYHGKCRWEV